MILGIDCGTATFGWARVSIRAEVMRLGAIVQGVDGDVAKSTDSSRRVSKQADAMEAEYRMSGEPQLQAIVHEAGSYNAKRFKMSVGLAMSIGSVVGFARAHEIPLYEIPPKTWQHAIVGSKGKVDYDDVYRRVEAYVARTDHVNMTSGAAKMLSNIKPANRNHALDAAGIALCFAIDPSLATRVR